MGRFLAIQTFRFSRREVTKILPPKRFALFDQLVFLHLWTFRCQSWHRRRWQYIYIHTESLPCLLRACPAPANERKIPGSVYLENTNRNRGKAITPNQSRKFRLASILPWTGWEENSTASRQERIDYVDHINTNRVTAPSPRYGSSTMPTSPEYARELSCNCQSGHSCCRVIYFYASVRMLHSLWGRFPPFLPLLMEAVQSLVKTRPCRWQSTFSSSCFVSLSSQWFPFARWRKSLEINFSCV